IYRANPLIPILGPPLYLRMAFRAGYNARHVAEEGRMRHVVERSQHGGHIPECRTLDAPLSQRAVEVALEIRDQPVAAREQNIGQVKIPMIADAIARKPRI